MQAGDVEIAVIGAGVAGIATAFYLCTEHGKRSIMLIAPRQPMSFTSAQSGENFRNWWPHRTMTAFTNHSIDLMERIAADTDNVLQMTRRGYAVATRKSDIDDLIEQLNSGYGEQGQDLIREQVLVQMAEMGELPNVGNQDNGFFQSGPSPGCSLKF